MDYTFTQLVGLAELNALTWSHPAPRQVRERWNRMSDAERFEHQADYARLECKLGPDGPCRCGQHEYQN